MKPVIARRGTEHGSALGTQRRVVERAFAHLHWFRHLRIRWEIRDDIHEAFLTLGCALLRSYPCALPVDGWLGEVRDMERPSRDSPGR